MNKVSILSFFLIRIVVKLFEFAFVTKKLVRSMHFKIYFALEQSNLIVSEANYFFF